MMSYVYWFNIICKRLERRSGRIEIIENQRQKSLNLFKNPIQPPPNGVSIFIYLYNKYNINTRRNTIN